MFNPKCIKMGELYGEYNLLTNEWTDGLGSTLIRNAVNDTTPDKKWVVFDGPVDAIWIENMNTGERACSGRTAWGSRGRVGTPAGGKGSWRPPGHVASSANPKRSMRARAVLDDNCTLCLPNGERIKLNPTTMRMLFEVQDLAVASPATVSRCGMVRGLGAGTPRPTAELALLLTWLASFPLVLSFLFAIPRCTLPSRSWAGAPRCRPGATSRCPR